MNNIMYLSKKHTNPLKYKIKEVHLQHVQPRYNVQPG